MYQLFQGWDGIIRGNIIRGVAVLSGFYLIALIRNWKKINLKYCSIAGAILFSCCFFFFFVENPMFAMGAYIFQGISSGIWHVARNNYELLFVKEKKRGVFQWNDRALKSVVKVITGLLCSGIFLRSKDIVDPYMILGIVAIALTIAIVVCCFRLPNSYEEKAPIKELKSIVKKKDVWKWTFLGMIGINAVFDVLFTISSYFILVSEATLSIYESVLTVISIFITLYIGKKICSKNRVSYLVICSILVCIALCIFANTIVFRSFLLVTIARITVRKFFNLAERINTLHMMDQIRWEEKSSFSVVVMRETFLSIPKILGLVVLLPFLSSESSLIVKVWFMILGIFYLLIGIVLAYQERKQKANICIAEPENVLLPEFATVENTPLKEKIN